jgi:hypothetical protein
MNYKKRVVGAYRHKNVLQCFTGMVGMMIFMRYHDEGDLSFLQPADKNERPLWQKERLMENWEAGKNGQEACYEVYKRICEICNIRWNKVTHLRSAGMEQGSARGGLLADQLATMSKHRGERLFDAYLTELLADVMLIMSGHGPNEPYFVPRTEIDELPYSLPQCIRRLFPNYDTWMEQLRSQNGDKHKSAENFLLKVIPLLTKVIIQDAPYWIKHFPNHEYSCRLSNLFPVQSFREWCGWAIQKAQDISEARTINEVKYLNDAAR